MTVCEFILAGKTRLAGAGLECADPLLHMKQITEAGLELDTTQIYLRWDSPLTDAEHRKLSAMLERRLKGEPFQYIVGYEWFWESKFKVGPGVLIPRRETELLVETALSETSAPQLKIAELGAGTGVIGICLLLERPGWQWFTFESNRQSLPYVKANRDALLPAKAGFFLSEGDFFQLAGKNAPYDWLIANPPYVARPEISTLSQEVRHEPSMALDGGVSGLDVLRRLAAESPRLLKNGGRVLFEIGSEQGPGVHEIYRDAGFADVRILSDYAGLPRAVLAKWDGDR